VQEQNNTHITHNNPPASGENGDITTTGVSTLGEKGNAPKKGGKARKVFAIISIIINFLQFILSCMYKGRGLIGIIFMYGINHSVYHPFFRVLRNMKKIYFSFIDTIYN
jgi:hypothetical protein